jgi:protein-tyrosine-phosphatase
LKSILFVCSGNTCRSPLAEVIARSVLGPGWAVTSAGSAAMEGMPASEYSVEIAANKGLDLTGHRSRTLSASAIAESDLIVTMGANHRAAIGIFDGDALDYTFLLSDFCDELDGDVSDPIGGGIEMYARTYDMIQDCIESMAGRLDEFDGWKAASEK